MFPHSYPKTPNILKKSNLTTAVFKDDQAFAAQSRYSERKELKDHNYIKKHNNFASNNFLTCLSKLERNDQFGKYLPNYYVTNDPDCNSNLFSNKSENSDPCEDKPIKNNIEKRKVSLNENIASTLNDTRFSNEAKSTQCKYCLLEFTRKYDLLLHTKTHIEEQHVDTPVGDTNRDLSVDNIMDKYKIQSSDMKKKKKYHYPRYRTCFVPGCDSNKKSYPDKNFVLVPNYPDEREKWFKAVNRDINSVSPLTKFYCCEDHFEPKKDTEQQYRRYQFMGSSRLTIRKDVVPHIFKKQADNLSTVKSEATETSRETMKEESPTNTVQDDKFDEDKDVHGSNTDPTPTLSSLQDLMNVPYNQYEIRIEIEESDSDWCIYDESVKDVQAADDEHASNASKQARTESNTDDSKHNFKENKRMLNTEFVIKKEVPQWGDEDLVTVKVENEKEVKREKCLSLHFKDGPEKIFECHYCSSTFLNENELFQHKRIWHGTTNKRFTSLTDDTFKNVQELVNVKTNNLSLVIEKDVFEKFDNFQKEVKLDKNFVSKIKVRYTDIKQKRTCTICNKEFNSHHFRAHMNEVHSETKAVCSECGARFKCVRYLRRHILYRHCNGTKPHQRKNPCKCLECPKSFKNSDCLSHHVRNCHGNKVECNLCHSKLKSISYLKSHMRRVHYDDGKKHRCKICWKEFKSPRQLKIHMINLHPESLHPCPNCIRLFCSAVQLKIHVKNCKTKAGPGARTNAEETDDEVVTVD